MSDLTTSRPSLGRLLSIGDMFLRSRCHGMNIYYTWVVTQERVLNRNTAMIFTPGQQVVWHYAPQRSGRKFIPVDAEVMQYGRLRTRIRIHTASNTVVFRWVHPKNLRPKGTDEPAYPYPAPH